MTRKTRFIKQCNKVGYLTKLEAENNRYNQSVYLCTNCNLFHCTTSEDPIKNVDKNRAKQMAKQMREFDEIEELENELIKKYKL